MKSQHIEFGELTFLNGTLSGQVQHSFSKLSIDSRSIVYPNISCFIAISGENFDGQDVGGRLGGVFREAATLAQTFGDDRVFNTPIQEAFIIGSTVGMSAVGLKPLVEVQFADYIWPGLNQLFTEVSRSYYLSNGKWPVSCVIRVPIGAYGSGGPYHSSSVESVLTNIRGVKVVYPSNGADLKGLLKAAYYDQYNPLCSNKTTGFGS